MKKLCYLLFILSPITGICGAILRAKQLSVTSGAEASPAAAPLWILCAISAVAAILAAFLIKKSSFPSKNSNGTFLSVAFFIAAALILVYTALLLFSLREEFETVTLILALLSLYCAVSLLVLGKYRMAERDSTPYCTFSAVPVFWACFLLILTFREKIADPIISNYVILIFSYISILFFTYSLSAHLLGKNKKHVAVISCFMGIFFILVELISPFLIGPASILEPTKLLELIPQLAFLILMPAATSEIIKK